MEIDFYCDAMDDYSENLDMDRLRRLITIMRYKFIVRPALSDRRQTIYQIVNTHTGSVLNDDEFVEWNARWSRDEIRIIETLKELDIDFEERTEQLWKFKTIRSEQCRIHNKRYMIKWDEFIQDYIYDTYLTPRPAPVKSR